MKWVNLRRLDYRDANLALQQGWRVMAVVPRGAITVYVLGKAAKAVAKGEGEYIGNWEAKNALNVAAHNNRKDARSRLVERTHSTHAELQDMISSGFRAYVSWRSLTALAWRRNLFSCCAPGVRPSCANPQNTEVERGW